MLLQTRFLFRILASLTLAGIILTVTLPRYSAAVANSRFGGFASVWLFVFSTLAPLYAIAEVMQLRYHTNDRTALWVDSMIAASCFLLFWGVMLYAFTHHAFV